MHKRDDIMVSLHRCCAFVLLLIILIQAEYAGRLNEWAKEEKSKGHTTPQVQPHHTPFFFAHSFSFYLQSDEPPMPDLRNVWYRSIKENVTEGDQFLPLLGFDFCNSFFIAAFCPPSLPSTKVLKMLKAAQLKKSK